MTHEEALRELGLRTDADAKTLRKAYLGLLKQRKPEKDPAGFMRLREAYEVLTLLDGWESVGSPPPPVGTPPSPARGSGPAAEPFPRDDDALASVRDAFAALPPDCSAEALVDVAFRQVELHPDLEEAYVWLFRALVSAGRDAEAAGPMRQAAGRGLLEPMVDVARIAPGLLSPDDLLLLASRLARDMAWALAEEISQRDVAQGCRFALILCAHHTPPPPGWFCGLLLEALDRGEFQAGRVVLEGYANTDLGRQALGQRELFSAAWAQTVPLDEVYLLCCLGELLELNTLPDGVRRALVRLLRGEAAVDLAACAPEHAEAVNELLVARAPLLRAHLRARDRRRAVAPLRRRRGVQIFVGVLFLMGVLALVVAKTSYVDAEGVWSRDPAVLLHSGVDRFCNGSNLGSSRMCWLASKVERDAVQHRCREVEVGLLQLETQTAQTPFGAATSALRSLSLPYCSPGASNPPSEPRAGRPP